VFLQAAVEAGVTHVIMEVSAQALTLHRLETIGFDGIIFTNFSQEHAEFYSSLEDYFEAKKQIFGQAKPEASLLINAEDAHGKQLQTLHKKSDSFGFANTDFYLSSYNTQNGLSGSICYRNQIINFHSPYIVGLFNLYNLLAAAGMAYKFGVPLQKIEQGLRTGRTAPGRMEMHTLSNGGLCVIDYAHTPSSFLAILTALRTLTDHLVIVFGCGGDRDRVKRPEMGRIASELGDYILITSDNPRSETVTQITAEIMVGINKTDYEKIECESDRATALQKAYKKSHKGTVIALLGKGPDEYEEVNGIKRFFSEKEIILGLDAQDSIFTKGL
jgi:UDP-N-acetylmuramoyl-L-alanyl-D-glutamate--2,6-diaminopimelate ligase